jgi:hypothetical protein
VEETVLLNDQGSNAGWNGTDKASSCVVFCERGTHADFVLGVITWLVREPVHTVDVSCDRNLILNC